MNSWRIRTWWLVSGIVLGIVGHVCWEHLPDRRNDASSPPAEAGQRARTEFRARAGLGVRTGGEREALAGAAIGSPGGAARARVRELLTAWIAREPEAALAWVRAQPAGVARNDLWALALAARARVDPRGALSLARLEVGGDAGRHIAEAIYLEWARADGAAALSEARSSLAGLSRISATSAILGEWARHDPAAAIDWVRQEANETQREELISVALRGMAQSEPDLAAGCLTLLGDGAVARQAAASLSARWAVEDLRAALTWFESLPAGEVRRAAQVGLLPAWIEQDPAGVARRWADLGAGAEALKQLGRNWAALDFTAASNWAGELDQEARADFITAAAGQRALDAPQEAAQLALSLPYGATRDAAMLAVAVAWGGSDPGAASAWLSQVADQSLRRRAVRDIMPIWAASDPVRAWQWLQALPAGPVRDDAQAAYQAARPHAD